jgi:hypothetical protein
MRWAKTLVVALVISLWALASAHAQTTGKAQAGVSAPSTSATAAASAGVKAPGAAALTKSSSSAGPQPTAMEPGPSAPRAASSGGMDGATYAVRLKDLEQRIDELKEQIRRSHTRLSLLTDTILSGGLAGSRSELQFQNDMSNAFRLVRALFVLDGAVQYNKSDDTGSLAEQKEIPIFSGSIPPGDHTVQVLLQFQGNGYGVFSYLKGYHFEVRSSHSFTAVEGRTLTLQIIAYEKGGVTTPLEERPAVRFTEKVAAGVAGPGAALPGASGPVAASPGNVSTGFSVGAGTGSK